MTAHDLLAPARVLRTVAPPDAPYPGRLVVADDERVQVWVDVRELEGVPAWAADTDGHILAPVDYARTRTGLAAVLPPCAMTVAALLARREALAPGEAVTLAVGLLRGAVEAHALEAVGGTWWLTTDGRPVLALVGETPWGTATADLLKELAGLCPEPLETLVARAAGAVAPGPRLARDAVQLETELFATCAGAPIVWQTTTSATPVPPVVNGAAEPSATAAVTKSILSDAIARHVDVGLAVRVGDALRAVRERLPRRTADRRPRDRTRPERTGRRSRAPILVGCAVAAAILAAGVLWPTGEPSAAQPADATAEAPETAGRDAREVEGAPEGDAAPADPEAAPSSADPAEAADAADATDPETAGVALLSAIAGCDASDVACLEGLVEDPARVLAAGVATAPGVERDVTLLDELGGVAVLRTESPAGDAAAQIVVLVSDGQKWLVREIYDLADQP